MPKNNPSLYQQAYHFLARNKGGADGRKKALRKIHRDGSPAFVNACDRVVRNNPHFLMKKSDPSYQWYKNRSYNKRKNRFFGVSKG